MSDFEYNNRKASEFRVYMKAFPSIPVPQKRYSEVEVSGKDGKYLEENGYEDIAIPLEASEFRVYMKAFPSIPVPQKRYSEVEVSGKDGKYLEENGYEDIAIPLELNFIIKDAKWHDRARQIKNWLLENMNRELIFEDDAAFFYKVKKVELGEIEHTTRRIGNLTVSFTCEPYTYLRNGKVKMKDDAAFFYKVKKVELGEIEHTTRRIGNLTVSFTCEPYTYLRNGKVKMKSEEAEQNPYLLCKPVYYVQGEGLIGNLTVSFTCEPYTYLRNGKVKMKSEEAEQNPYLLCKPVYYVQGEGLCVINVNGKDMEANVSGNLIIDTERMLAYREDGTLGNTKITGEYEDLYLKPGRNRISVSPGFTMRVKPNWRCL